MGLRDAIGMVAHLEFWGLRAFPPKILAWADYALRFNKLDWYFEGYDDACAVNSNCGPRYGFSSGDGGGRPDITIIQIRSISVHLQPD